MRLITMLLLLAAVLLVAARPAARMNDLRAPASQGQRDPQMNRHVDAHVPTRAGEPTASTGTEPTRRRAAQDPFRGAIQPPPPPTAVQPPRDRRY